MKKLLLILSLLASSVLLVGCKTEKPESLHDSYMQTTSLQTTIGMEALTSAQILSNMDMGSDVKFGFNSSNPQKTSIDDIKPYIELFEQMLATNQGLEIVVAESDLEDYSYMITYHMQTLLNETTTLTIYYNIVNPTPIEDEELIDEPIVVEDETTETLSVGFNFNLNLDGETDDLDDDDDAVNEDDDDAVVEDDDDAVVEDDDDDAVVEDDDDAVVEDDDDDAVVEDDDDDETVIQIEGILLFHENTYDFVGKIIQENDETKVIFMARNENQDRILLKQVTEDDEKKLDIKRFDSTGIVESHRIRVEIEDDETVIHMDYKKGNTRSFYKFKLETEDDETILKIHYRITEENIIIMGIARVYVLTDDVTGETYYEIYSKDEGKNEEHQDIPRQGDGKRQDGNRRNS